MSRGRPATTVDAGRPSAAVGVERASAADRRALVRAAAQRSLWRRRLAGRAALAVCALAMAAALVPVVAEFGYTVARGAGDLSLGFLLHPPTPPGVIGGGISTAIAGSARIVGLALAMAVPVALLAALFLHERRGRLAGALRFAADVLSGVPSIVIGIFAYTLVVRPLHHFSDVAASVAIAVLMLPIMVRADEEALRGVAVDLWEAGVGETAPLLFTVAAPTAAMTLLVFSDGTQAFTPVQRVAWATALVLLALVLVLSVVARVVAWSLSRKAR